MSDYLLHLTASNWCMSAMLAAFAWLAQSKLRQPMIAHLLWLLVLVKLVTPPLFTLPLLPLPTNAPAVADATAIGTTDIDLSMLATVTSDTATNISATSILLTLWLLGSVAVLVWSCFRIVRFHRLLTLASQPAPSECQQLVNRLAQTLGLKKPPTVHTTSARVSPMVWWLGGRVRIFIPATMQAEIGADKLRWILAHEVAHVRRRDHFVRWLEWLTCVCFWWNPVAWLARRNLRANEEICCDALVLRSFACKPHSYANSLLAAVEFLATPGLRPPAMASEINSGGFLERRFRMIVSKTPITTAPRWLQAVLVACTVALMPLGVAYAQDPDVGAVSKRLRKAVQAGELTGAQARTMLGVLKSESGRGANKRKHRKQAADDYDRLKVELEKLESAKSKFMRERRVTDVYTDLARQLGPDAGKEIKAALETIERERHKLRQMEQDVRLRADESMRSHLEADRKPDPRHRKKDNTDIERYARLLRDAMKRRNTARRTGARKERDLTKYAAELRKRELKLRKERVRQQGDDLRRRDADLRRRLDELRTELKDVENMMRRPQQDHDRLDQHVDRSKVEHDTAIVRHTMELARHQAKAAKAATMAALDAELTARALAESRALAEDKINAAGRELKELVAAGKISKAEAKAKHRAMTKKMVNAKRKAKKAKTKKSKRTGEDVRRPRRSGVR